MESQINSPNWGWKQIGYKIEYYGKKGKLRRIRDCLGLTVLENAGYEGEVYFLRAILVIEDL